MKKFVLYGAGWQAEKFLYQFREKESIAYCIDGIRTGVFKQFPIYTLDSAPDIHNYQIIVTAVWENYIQIRECLEEKQLHEFQDFIWSEAFGKKLVLINANCHGEFYKRYLYQSKTFKQEYVIWNLPPFHIHKSSQIPDKLLSRCDLFIHQDVRPENPFGYKFSDEYIIPRLKPGCRTITVPNMVGMGRWNFPTMGMSNEKEYRYGRRAMFWRDSILDDAYHLYKKGQEIKTYIMSPDVFPQEKVRELFLKCMEKLQKRERNWDIKISDYILAHYKAEKLFYDCDHAADCVMQEIGKRLCRKLGIEDVDGKLEYFMNWEESFIFPYVKQALELSWDEKYIREEGNGEDYVISGGKMDLDEYIREYIWWFYGERIE